jgi:hypothetical protein
MAKKQTTVSRKVQKTTRERKRGTLETGSGKRVASRKQAVAIGMAEARKAGAHAPKKRGATKRKAARKAK